MSDTTHYISISTGTLFRLFFSALALYLAFLVIDIIGAVLVAVVIAAAVEPVVRWMMNHRLPRTISIVLIFLVITLIIVLAAYSIVPELGNELQRFVNDFPVHIANLRNAVEIRFPFLPANSLFNHLEEYIASQDLSIESLTEAFYRGAPVIFDRIFIALITIVLAFYLAIQENGVAKFLRLVSPEKYDEYVVDVWYRSQKKIERWLQGQLLLSAIVGAIVYVGLTLLHVQFALTLAIISAIFEIFPFFGPIIASIPAIIIATIQNPLLGLFVLVLYLGVQQLENHLIYPVVMRKMVGVPPMIAILALLIGGRLAGIFGLLLAVPVIVVLSELLSDRERQKHREVAL